MDSYLLATDRMDTKFPGSSGNLVGRCMNRAFSVIFRHERNNDKTLPRIARVGSKLEGEFGRLSTGEQVG